MARLRCSVVLFAASMLPVWGQNFVTGPNTGAESRLDNTPRNVTFFLTVTGSGIYNLAGGIFYMKDGTSTTGNVTLTVFNSASVALSSVTLSNSQFCSNDPAHCQQYSYRTFNLPPAALPPGSYTLVLSTNAPPQQNSAYFVKGGGTSFTVMAGGGGGAPNLSISKVSSPANFTGGMAGAYSVQVTNVGNAASSGVITVMDTLGPNQTFVSATGSGWSCSAAGQVVTCTTSAVIAAGASASPITINVNISPTAPTSVTNNVTVAGGGGTNTNNSFTLVTPVSAPNLSVLKTSNTATFTQGQNGVYTIQVNNVGNGATSGAFTVTDMLDTNLTFVSASGSGWSCSATGQVVTCTTGAVIAAGGSASPITLTVSVLANGESSVTNTGTVSGDGDVDLSNNSFQLVTPVVVPKLSVSKTATPSAFTKGQNGVYTILVSNGGTAPSSGVITVTDTLDPNLTFVSATPPPGWTCMPAGQVVTCTTSTAIAVGASVSITITVNVGASAPTTVTNNVTVSGGGSATNSSQLVSAVDATDLTISKTANPAIFTQGQQVVYTITASNIGNAASSGLITVTDTLGPNLTYVSATGSGWSCSAAAQVVTCTTSAVIAAGASSPPITLTANVAANGQISATNIVTISGGGNVVNSNTSFTLVSVVNGSNLSVSKTANPATFTQGQSGAYTITTNNFGNAPSSGTITVTDTLDPNLTFVNATGSGWSCSAATQVVTCTTSAVIAAGASAPPITINVKVSATAPTSVTNNVTVAGGGGTNTNNSFQLVSNVSSAGPPPVQGVPATTTPMLILTGMALIGLVVWLRRRATYRG